MYPHRIRLRGPWEGGPVGETPRRVTVPWQNGPDRLTRNFGYPGRIDAHERVWLTVENVAGRASFALNGQPLGAAADGPFAFDITSFLKPHNELIVTLEGTAIGEVALEVRATAYLEEVKVAQREGKLELSGKVSGTCDRMLELYVLVDRRHAHYQPISAGESFRAVLDEPGQLVRVELINVSVVWYAVELFV